MSSRSIAAFLALAALAIPLPVLGEEGSQEGDRHSRRSGFFERFHDFKHFPVGRGRIGLQIQPMTPELREFMGAPADRGVLVERVVEDSPAQAAGLRVGDVITEAGGEPIEGPIDLIRAVHSLAEAEPLEIAHVREGQTRTVAVTPEPHPERQGAWDGIFGVDGAGCDGPTCEHHPRGELRKRLDEVEERLRELEKHVLPGMDSAEAAT